MPELNPVKLQAENIDLRTELEKAKNRVACLEVIVMRTADVHELADVLERDEMGDPTDEFFRALSRKVRAAAQAAEREGRANERVPMEEFAKLDEELQAALARESECRAKIETQAAEVRQAKTEARKAVEDANKHRREATDLQEQVSMLQEMVTELEAERDRQEPASPAAPPPPPPPPPPPAAPVIEPEVLADLRRKASAFEKAEAEKKIAIHVKDRALQDCAAARSDVVRLKAILDGTRVETETMTQVALNAARDDVQDLRSALRAAESNLEALQAKYAKAENEKLEAQAALAERGHGTSASSSSGQLFMLPDLEELLLPPTVPPHDAHDDVAAVPDAPPSVARLLKERLAKRAAEAKVKPHVLASATTALNDSYRRLSAEVRLVGPQTNPTARHAALLDTMLSKEIQIQQVHEAFLDAQAAFGARIAAKESEYALAMARALAAEAKLRDVKLAAHAVQLQIADAVGRGGADASGFLQGAASPSPNGGDDAAQRTAAQASDLLRRITELNGLLNALPVPTTVSTTSASTGTAATPAADDDQRTPQRFTRMADAAASPSAAKQAVDTLDLMERVKQRHAKQQAVSDVSTVRAVTGAGNGASTLRVSSKASSPAGGESVGRTAAASVQDARFDEALVKAVSLAQQLAHSATAGVAQAASPAAAAVSPSGALSPAAGTCTTPATPSAEVEAALEVARQKLAEDLASVLLQKEVEISALQDSAASQTTLVDLLRRPSTSEQHEDPQQKQRLGQDPQSLFQRSPTTKPASSFDLRSELAAAKAAAALAEAKLASALTEIDALRLQVRNVKAFAETDAEAAASRLRDAEARQSFLERQAQSREEERDRAIATGTRLQELAKRQQGRRASASGHWDPTSPTNPPVTSSTAATAANFDTAASNEPGSLNTSVNATAASPEFFANLLKKVHPRSRVDENVAAELLSQALLAYDDLLKRVEDQPSSDRGVPALGATASTNTAVGGSEALTPEDAHAKHEEALIELLFDAQLKLWHSHNDYLSMRAIVDMKVSDKDEERNAVLKAKDDEIKMLKAHIDSLYHQMSTPRLASTTGVAAEAAPNSGAGNIGQIHADIERQMRECNSRIELLRAQLTEKGISPNA